MTHDRWSPSTVDPCRPQRRSRRRPPARRRLVQDRNVWGGNRRTVCRIALTTCHNFGSFFFIIILLQFFAQTAALRDCIRQRVQSVCDISDDMMSSFTCVADVPHRRRFRFASTEQLDVPTCRRSTIGGRAFPVAGANGLPSDVTSASSQPVSKNRLKTYLFRRCYYETV